MARLDIVQYKSLDYDKTVKRALAVQIEVPKGTTSVHVHAVVHPNDGTPLSREEIASFRVSTSDKQEFTLTHVPRLKGKYHVIVMGWDKPPKVPDDLDRKHKDVTVA